MTGGMIGLYFGLFFTPLRPASYQRAIILSILLVVVMVAIRYIPRSRPALDKLPSYATSTFLKFAFILLVLEARHPAYDIGGRTTVIMMTTLMGAWAGWWYAQSSVDIEQKT